MEMKKFLSYLSGAVIALSLTACGNNEQASSPGPASTAPAAVAEAPGPELSQGGPTKGKILETMEASGYTYLSLDDGSGTEVWAAVPKTQLEVGEEVTLQGGSVMSNFSSKTLGRTFESIIFASGVLREGDAAVEAGPGAGGSFDSAVAGEDGGGSGGSAGNIAEFADLKVEKATAANAQTVEQIFTQVGSLDTQKVTVKGQVVKVSRNIMGKNWLHIQDGTGDPAVKNHDLVVTTDGIAEKGAIVTIEGVVAANKDFGSGYKYDVIVEDAVVVE